MLKVRQICKDSKEEIFEQFYAFWSCSDPTDLMDVIGVFVDPVGVWVVLVDPVGLPIDLMGVIGVFVDPVGVWVVLVDPVGLPIDLMDVIGVFVHPMGVQRVHEHIFDTYTYVPASFTNFKM